MIDASASFVSMEVELQYYKALVVELQWKLDQKEVILSSYDTLVKDALKTLNDISKGVKHATE